jgi:hypothetical protein
MRQIDIPGTEDPCAVLLAAMTVPRARTSVAGRLDEIERLMRVIAAQHDRRLERIEHALAKLFSVPHVADLVDACAVQPPAPRRVPENSRPKRHKRNRASLNS